MVARWHFIRGRMKMPCKIKMLAHLLVHKKKSTHKFLRKCLVFFALPQGLEPWTL